MFNPGVVARATYVAHSHKIYFFSKTNHAKFLRFRVLKVVYLKDALSAAQASVAPGRDDSRLAKYAGYDCSPRDQLRNREIAQIEAWLAEDDSENEVFGDQPSSNEEEDHLEESDHQSESEQDGELPGEISADNSEPEEPPQRVRHTEFYAGVDSQKLLL
ncbi:hypothetical protein EVAR_61767_1 [Eumeta japonica]|uniref:Uncharacterized protein n=1 Tax=Eumeta variegata TaxID=151549 RepID=A0A4C1Z3D9_EUMVA|nr:hypothetical protein EVAR_61767_1 [Eumeta japonica]